jgi:hypothetical protein
VLDNAANVVLREGRTRSKAVGGMVGPMGIPANVENDLCNEALPNAAHVRVSFFSPGHEKFESDRQKRKVSSVQNPGSVISDC